MSPSAKAQLCRVKDRVPRNGKGPENLLAQLGQYLKDPGNKYVQKIVVDARKPFLYVEKMVPEDQAEKTDLSLHEAIRNKPMTEINLEGAALEAVWKLFWEISKNGYETAHLVVSPNSKLYEWVSLPRQSERLFGVPIHKMPEIPDDVVILTGATVREADPEDIEYSAKGTIP